MKKIISVVVSIFICLSLFAQQYYSDAGLWTTFELEKKVNKKFTGLFTQEWRVKENFSRLNLFYTNLGIEYKYNKHFKAALIYRWIDKYMEDNNFSYRNRLMLDLSFKNKIGPIALTFRHRLQAEKRDIFTSSKGLLLTEWYSRSKLGIKYNINKPITPYASTEIRYQINNLRNIESNHTFHRIRYALGLEYKLNDNNSISGYYLIQREWNVNIPNRLYIVGIEYSLSL